jgi:hypothetical protein
MSIERSTANYLQEFFGLNRCHKHFAPNGAETRG